MNVAFDPWIPVVSSDGKPQLVSVHSVFTKGENYADLSVRPHERVSLMRLFLCIAHAALNGPKDYDEWLDCPEKLPVAADAYLRKWKDSFELFHPERPWLQVANISKSNEKSRVGIKEISTEELVPVSKLNFAMSTGNNTTLFDHEGIKFHRQNDLGQTVISMITYQCFSPGGLISQVYWNGKQSNKTSKDGPCAQGSMVHALLRGDSIYRSIILNMATHEDISLIYGDNEVGCPVWEKMPSFWEDPAAVNNATRTYVGRLMPLTRLILLHPSGNHMIMGDGLIYPTFADSFPQEPTATVVIRKKNMQEERALLAYRPGKAIWRELGGIVAKKAAQENRSPLCLKSISEGLACDLIVAALSRDKATIVGTTESVYHVPAEMFSDSGTSSYETEVHKAERLSDRLNWAIELYRKEIDPGWEGRLKAAGSSKSMLKAKLHSIATTHYWTTVEKNLDLLMEFIKGLGSDEAVTKKKQWRQMVYSAALDSYQVACGQETPRQMKAFVKGWKVMTGYKQPQANPVDQDKMEARI